MTIRHLRIFIAVASTGSITRAAEALYLTQPTVSIAIRELEEHYGTRFFERISQRLKITEEGKALLSYASHLISLYDEIETSFQNPDSRGALKIGASINAGSGLMPELISRFQKEHPHLRVHVYVNTTEMLEKLLLANELDLAVAGGVIHSPLLSLHRLFTEIHLPVCAPDHPLAEKTIPLREFMSMPLLFREKGSGVYEAFQAAASTSGCLMDPSWESSSQEALVEAARLGLGVTILPESRAVRELESHSLARIYISDYTFRNTVTLVYHKNKFISPALARFMDMLKASSRLRDA